MKSIAIFVELIVPFEQSEVSESLKKTGRNLKSHMSKKQQKPNYTMKNFLILAVFVLLSTATFAQVLPKGTLVGVHTFSIKLNGKTTMQQFEDAVKAKWVPASSKAFSCQSHVLKFVRGKSANKMGVLIIYKNDAERNKFYNPDGTMNAGGNAANAKMKPVADELAKLGTMTDEYTDWVVQ